MPGCDLPNPQHSPSSPATRCPNTNETTRHNRSYQGDRASTPSTTAVLRHLPSPPPHGPRLHRRSRLRRRASHKPGPDSRPAHSAGSNTSTTSALRASSDTRSRPIPSWLPASTPPCRTDRHAPDARNGLSATSATTISAYASSCPARYGCIDAAGHGYAAVFD